MDTEFIRREYDQVLKVFHIAELIDRKVHSLSGGEKQRVLLAGMLISDAKVLLLDEPVTKLDSENKELILQMIQLGIPGRIVIIVSHIKLDFNIKVRFLELKEGKIYEK